MHLLFSVLSLIMAIALAPRQNVSDRELLNLIARAQFPTGCGDARVAVNAVRATSTTDPQRLRATAATFDACAVGPYGLNSNAVANVAYFSAAAAALLAARHETSAATMRADAGHATRWAQIVIDFRQTPGNFSPSRPADPSPLITDAGRIKADALALLSEAS